ncbi:MAG: hypothetical protein SFV51_24610 [Bryobacteraceae bacterium]|nr:hypothetical protein [Bryobacteraceae bacterium]
MKSLALVIALGVGPLHTLRADEFVSWEWLVPKPAGNILTKVIFDGTRFVGVGDLGVILTSTNGTNWHLAYTDTTNRLMNVFAEGGRLLAIGDGFLKTYLSSTNAEVWARGPEVFGTGGISCLSYGLDRYVLVSGHPHIFYWSTDTSDWQQAPYNLPGAIFDMAFGDGLFVGVGQYGLIATSTNSVDWVLRESGTAGPIWSVAHGEGKWVAVGGEGSSGFILTSADGISWFLQTTDQPLYDVTFGPFGFIVIGGGFMQPGVSLTSGDGVYFSGGDPGGTGLDGLPTGVACGNGVCVAVGGNGRIWSMEDGTNWVSQTVGTTAEIRAFAADGEVVVAAGAEGTLLRSENGVDFEEVSVRADENYHDVIHTGSRFLVVGSPAIARSSLDGREWTLENTGTDARLYRAAQGLGRTVVVARNATKPSYGLFLVRDETGQWQSVRPAENEYLFDQIAFGNGRFVTAGYDGNIWVSSDGLQWQKRNAGVTETLQPLQFIQGRFIAFTRNAVGFSDNGLDWSFVPGNPPTTGRLTYGNGLYVAASRISSSGVVPNGIDVSADGIQWQRRPVMSREFTAATYFKDAFYVSGFILKSASSLVPQFERKVFLPDLVLFDLFGKVGRDYELQSSGDLVNWELEEAYHQATRLHTVTRPAAPDQRFYRVKLKEP